MAPKNKKKTGFYYFMKELQEMEAAKGCIIPMKSMPNYANPKWTKMSLAEKEPYEEMARQYNKDPSFRSGKLASDGTRVEDNLLEEEERKQQENRMIQSVQLYIDVDCGKDQFIETAPKKFFYFLSFNVLCRTDEDDFVPIEVGLVEYSIKYGVLRHYTKILYPGSPPKGYAGAAKKGEEKHEISIFGEENSERDMRRVYEEIKAFINPIGNDEYPPVFCIRPHITATLGCLDWLAFVSKKENVFEVLDATVLLMELRAGLDMRFQMYSIAYDLLNKASFNYHESTRCAFHQEKDSHHCALSYSMRVCYLLSDAVCNLFNVQLTDKHMPNIATEEKPYRVTVFKEEPSHFGHDKPVRLDKTQSYYQNSGRPEEREVQAPKPSQPRQPAASSIAEQMQRLRLERTSATVPGHGIGRGMKRN